MKNENKGSLDGLAIDTNFGILLKFVTSSGLKENTNFNEALIKNILHIIAVKKYLLFITHFSLSPLSNILTFDFALIMQSSLKVQRTREK